MAGQPRASVGMQKIGSYEILDLLKSGPRPLYKAKAADGRTVALKTLPAQQLSETARERFLREAAICREFDHPNLVRVLDSGEAGGVLYQAMDLLEGSDLAAVFAERRQLSWEMKLSLMEQLCSGLAYAHDRKLVHRDIKPANLFLETSGRLRILDFGMARPDTSNLTQLGSAVGTLNYMAPEQIRAEPCGPACDIFNAGIVCYQIASGRHPFSQAAASVAQIVSAILFDKPAPLHEVAPDAPDGLEFVIDRALEKEPEKRWASVADYRRGLALCRLTIGFPAAPEGAEPQKDAGAAKTVLIPRAKRPAPAAPLAQEALTVGAPPVAASAGPLIAVRPPEKAKSNGPVLARAEKIAYCPTCTAKNVAGAPVCSSCGVPLTSIAEPSSGPAATPRWGLMALIAAVTILISVLILAYASIAR